MPDDVTPVVTTEPTTDPKPDKTKELSGLTNAAVNDLVQAEKANAIAALLKEVGIESTGKLKEDVKAYKAWQDSQKTEAEKLAGQNKEYGEKLTAAEARAIAAETKAEAMIQGVDPAKAERAAKLIPAYDGETAAEKVKAFLDENPEFKIQTGPAMPNTGKVKSGTGDNTDALRASVGKAFGLKGSL